MLFLGLRELLHHLHGSAMNDWKHVVLAWDLVTEVVSCSALVNASSLIYPIRL